MTQFNMAKTKSDTLHVQGINVGIYTEDSKTSIYH